MSNNLFVKTASIAICSVGTALLFSFLLKNFINSGALLSLVFLILGTVLFLAVFFLQSLLLNNFSINLGIAIVDGVLMIGVFFNSISILILAAGIFVIGSMLTAYYAAQLELKNNLDIRFFKIGNNLTRIVSSGLAIFGIIVYLSLLNLKDPAEAKKALSVVIKPSEPITAAYIPGFTIDHSLTEVAAKLLPAELKLAPLSQKQAFIQASAERLSGTIGGFLKVPVRVSDSLVDIFYKATVAKFLQFSSLVQTLILIGVGLLSFFFIKFFLFFINWIAIILAFGGYQLLWGAQFFKVKMESKTKKTIVLEEITPS